MNVNDEWSVLLFSATALAHDLPAEFADRLRATVIRPLSEALGRPSGEAATTADGGVHGQLWELCRTATRLRAGDPDLPLELVEATAALQDLACELAAQEGPEVVAAHVDELRRLQADVPAAIQVMPDGPYLMTNVDEVRTWLGTSMPVRPQMAFCRCGKSARKPFCDGTHAATGFSGAKDPSRVPDRRDRYVGQQVTVLDNRGICQHSGFCTDRLATVFHADGEPFVTASGGRMDEIIRAVRDCPSGALSYAIDGTEAREHVDQPREPAIEVTRDGPYRVTGGIPLRAGDGGEEPRAEGASPEHYALCRCGHSRNKPFCSGMHYYVEFRDPLPDPAAQPTVFEWAGGLPALTRMTRLFYERHVPQDPLLAPLFAEMSADHPERVAAWLSEVFGGPKDYSDRYGGYPRMLSQHVGKGISEQQRARWVELLTRSAREAGLPNDPEFQSAFHAYVEWGSRLAVENSQPGARPPEHMPMPHWEWTTSAGAPGDRISALAPPAEEEVSVALPGRGDPVGFADHIKPLFRERDRRSMRFAFDLWSYDDVRTHGKAILARVRDGSMPCDRPWPAEWVAVLARWVESGTAP